jgi:hypothetical protein
VAVRGPPLDVRRSAIERAEISLDVGEWVKSASRHGVSRF